MDYYKENKLAFVSFTSWEKNHFKQVFVSKINV